MELPIDAKNGLNLESCKGCRNFKLVETFIQGTLRKITCEHFLACKRVEDKHREES